MTRTIKASEIRPGMTIRWWDSDGNSYQIKVDNVAPSIDPNFVILDGTDGRQIRLGEIPQITVLSEPASAQPEEPTEFGAKVIVDGRRFIRADDYVRPWLESEVWTWYTWAHLCEMGPVTVVPDPGWTVPDTPEVPERIDEWPEDDRALRAFMWRDRYRCVWMWNAGYSKWECHNAAGDYMRTIVRPVCGPWTRVTDA
jgi:hypothetical protein